MTKPINFCYSVITSENVVMTHRVGHGQRRIVPHQAGLTSSLAFPMLKNYDGEISPPAVWKAIKQYKLQEVKEVLGHKIRRMLSGVFVLMCSTYKSGCPVKLGKTNLQFMCGHAGFEGLHSSFMSGCALLYSPKDFHRRITKLVNDTTNFLRKNSSKGIDLKLIVGLLKPNVSLTSTLLKILETSPESYLETFRDLYQQVKPSDYRFVEGQSLLEGTFFQCSLGSGDVLCDFYNQFDDLLESILTSRIIALSNWSSVGASPFETFQLLCRDLCESLKRAAGYFIFCGEQIDKFLSVSLEFDSLEKKIIESASQKDGSVPLGLLLGYCRLIGQLVSFEVTQGKVYDQNKIKDAFGLFNNYLHVGDRTLKEGPSQKTPYWPVSEWGENDFDRYDHSLINAFKERNKMRIDHARQGLFKILGKGKAEQNAFWKEAISDKEEFFLKALSSSKVAFFVVDKIREQYKQKSQSVTTLRASIKQFREKPTALEAENIVKLTFERLKKGEQMTSAKRKQLIALYTFAKSLITANGPLKEILSSKSLQVNAKLHCFGLSPGKKSYVHIPYPFLEACKQAKGDVGKFFNSRKSQHPKEKEAIDFTRSNYEWACALRKLVGNSHRVGKKLPLTSLVRLARKEYFNTFLTYFLPNNPQKDKDSKDRMDLKKALFAEKPRKEELVAFRSFIERVLNLQWLDKVLIAAVQEALPQFSAVAEERKSGGGGRQRSFQQFRENFIELREIAIPTYLKVVQKEFFGDQMPRIQLELDGTVISWKDVPHRLKLDWLLPSLLSRRVRFIPSSIAFPSLADHQFVSSMPIEFIFNYKRGTVKTSHISTEEKALLVQDLIKVGSNAGEIKGYVFKLSFQPIQRKG